MFDFVEALSPSLKVFLLSTVPIIELRGAIPLGVIYGLPWMRVFLLAVAGNMLPVPFIIVGLRHVLQFMKRIRFLKPLVERIEQRLQRKAQQEKFKKFSFWALVLFVAIPLPGTGAWTGAGVAALLGMRLKQALPAIAIGVLVAGFLVSGLSYGFLEFSKFFA